MRSSEQRPNLFSYTVHLHSLPWVQVESTLASPPSFGAHQFDDAYHKEVQMKPLFFNCFFFVINGAILRIMLLVYAQQVVGFRWDFRVFTVVSICSVLILVAGIPYYRFKKLMGSPFTRVLQVVVASTGNHLNGVYLTNHETPLSTRFKPASTMTTSFSDLQKSNLYLTTSL